MQKTGKYKVKVVAMMNDVLEGMNLSLLCVLILCFDCHSLYMQWIVLANDQISNNSIIFIVALQLQL